MDDEEFTPKLGKMRSRGKEARYLGLVVKAARRAGKRRSTRSHFDGSRIGRGAAVARVLRLRDRSGGHRARRVVVKFRLVKLAGNGLGGAKAHLLYLRREGVSREGVAGTLYSADIDDADGKDFLARADGDRHQFRLIVSPEDGDQISDLRRFTRDLMQAMEKDLGTGLDWVAVDHFNTGHPHSHIVVRGRNDRGADLIIAREYISHGLRERAGAILTRDLGPRTDLEIEARLRADTGAERLTAIDRQLLREMDDQRLVTAHDDNPAHRALRTGRLQKLARMNLATHMGGSSWRLEPGLADTLRRMGERGDIVRTMQREITARALARPPADHVIFDPERTAAPVVGRVVARGLADEHRDRHYLLVDGVDGRLHYADIGAGEAIEATPENAVVRITPRAGAIRAVDRTIVEVAAANGGRYTADAHLRHDPGAREAFAETHVRRLEAMRRVARNIEREPDGSWIIAPDHLEKVEAFERQPLRSRPVDVEMLSSRSVEQLVSTDAATWLDREIVADAPVALRDAGFGTEVRAAQALRRQWLLTEGFAEIRDGRIVFRKDMIQTLQRREMERVARGLSVAVGKPYREARTGDRIEGRLVRSVDMASGRHALVEQTRDFTLVPWRAVLDRHIGKSITGTVRAGGIDWSLGRQRGGPSIS